MTGQARTDAAQAQGFDPAFVALINFAQVPDPNPVVTASLISFSAGIVLGAGISNNRYP